MVELKSPHDQRALLQEEGDGRGGGQGRLHLAHKVNKIQEELSFFGEWKPKAEDSRERDLGKDGGKQAGVRGCHGLRGGTWALSPSAM